MISIMSPLSQQLGAWTVMPMAIYSVERESGALNGSINCFRVTNCPREDWNSDIPEHQVHCHTMLCESQVNTLFPTGRWKVSTGGKNDRHRFNWVQN